MMEFLTRIRNLSFLTKSHPTTPSHLQVQCQDILNGRYRVLERLGQGTEATVWLAQEITTPSNKFAVKVLTDFVTSLQGTHAFELRVMERISHLPQTHPGVRHLLSLHDHFSVRGPQGNHLCIVTEALGPSLLDLQSSTKGYRLPPTVVKHISHQILSALQALHDCDIVHTDIKMDNVLFRVNDNGFDSQRVCEDDNVVLVDYGTAMPLEVQSDRLVQPEALRSPEVLLGCHWDTKADIWNVGCVIFELLTGHSLFKPRAIATFTADQYHLARIFGTLVDNNEFDRVATYFRSSGHYYKDFFNDRDGLRLRIGDAQRESLQTILEIYNVYDASLLELLTAMLQVHPDDRPSAKELQNFAWFGTK
ncbi:kinase-like protein [Lentinula novae-zelandiae]|nr:kinase-like protein [Lentinula novae-zelandiae]